MIYVIRMNLRDCVGTGLDLSARIPKKNGSVFKVKSKSKKQPKAPFLSKEGFGGGWFHLQKIL